MKKHLLFPILFFLARESNAQVVPGLSQWTTTGTNIYYNTGNVGIGTSRPMFRLHVDGGSIGGTYALTPAYTDWSAYGVGDGGAAIYNDNGVHKELIIAGNRSAGGLREVGIWDNLTVHSNSIVAGSMGIGISTNTPTGRLQVNGRLVIDNVGSGGPMGSGSLLSFSSSGGADVTAIQENNGLNLNGSATAPVKISNASLLVGYVSGGSNYGQGNLLAAGNVGIGTPNPHAQLQLGNTTGNRKLVLLEDADNDHQFYGLGVLKARPTSTFRFQIPSSTNAYRFFRGNDAASSTELFTILGNGNVGVGTDAPAYPLQVAGKIGANGLFIDSATPAINTPETAQYLHIYNRLNANGLKAGGILVSDDYSYADPGKNDLIIKGKVAIGTPLASNPNNYTLAVNGQIGAKDVRVESTSATWPDYVFEPTYELPSLKEVDGYLKANKHLKELPSAREVTENGHSLGQMDALLLKKIEELTLYMINQDHKLEAQQQEIETLKKRLQDRK
ncbi:hypothetical protein IC235_15125 [Hymenobacter sp. BT664]|uniref:Peptidase S74 domain-containing protein n=1 Tax=Hymenobacter montanus TaxID=2771359 RepID=A0A927BE95_9BACT|nr:hypothetical protein [Hymenobacter montanus]MBD2769222.1 hypothetical protein [Hymenobacter montanus]